MVLLVALRPLIVFRQLAETVVVVITVVRLRVVLLEAEAVVEGLTVHIMEHRVVLLGLDHMLAEPAELFTAPLEVVHGWVLVEVVLVLGKLATTRTHPEIRIVMPVVGMGVMGLAIRCRVRYNVAVAEVVL